MDETTFENNFKDSRPHGFGFAQWESFHIDKEMSNYYPEANILSANIPLLICIGENDMAMPEKRARQTYQNLLHKGFDKVTYKVIPEEVHQYKKFDVFGVMDAWIQSDFTSTKFEITPEETALIEKYVRRQQWVEELNSLPYEGNHSGEVIAFFNNIKQAQRVAPGNWFTLGVKLFGNDFRKEAQHAFSIAAVKGNLIESAALVWLGHLSDLNNERDKALSFYRRALECYPGFGVQHSQWGIELNREWIEERLERPFAF
jgi:tetratricopeptide (TPR) repeat protein